MSDDARAAIVRQLRLHLEGLRAAGIDFLPISAPPAVVPAAPVAAPVSVRESVKQGVPVPPPEPVATAALFDTPAAPLPDTPDGRRHELTVLAGHVSGCSRCPQLYATRTQTVYGVGPIDPDVCFVGEAPGADEDATGEPFVGKAGQLLNKIIAACGFKREEVYICNTLKCRPPNNRTPTPEETHNCREYFDRQLALVRPKYIVALGGTAAKNLLGTTVGIMRLRGKMYEYKGIPVLCTFHPSFLLRDETRKKDAWEDMKMLLKTMGRPVPGAKA